MSTSWFKSNTFHHSDFEDVDELIKGKKKNNLSISLVFPTLNEEVTIGKEIDILKSELMEKKHLLDEIIVVDSGSTDKTRKECEARGVDFYLDKEILPNLEIQYRGKGENLWKALYVTKGDIILYIDSDIKNMHPRFVYGLLGPLIMQGNRFKFSKAFYTRPISDKDGNVLAPSAGGRVTELVAKPLFSLFCPCLADIIQPLSGEYAGYREILEQLYFPIGYGIETSMLLDMLDKWGMDIIAQVDLKRRIHRNQDIQSLGRMSFGIMTAFLDRIEKKGLIDLKTKLNKEMIQYTGPMDNKYKRETSKPKTEERVPIIEIEEYRNKFKRNSP